MPDLPPPFAAWTATPLAGDASSRRYHRLVGPDGNSAILMDAGAESAESLAAFRRIGAVLRDAGLAAPAILWADEARRVLVTEDLGQAHLGQWIATHPADETAVYAAATDVLVVVDRMPLPRGLARLDAENGAAMIAPVFESYAPDTAPEDAARIAALLRQALAEHAGPPDRLALRDYFSENLIWRPDRTGTDRIGLLDFQDALIAPRGYDLASLLTDVRRDLAPGLRPAMCARFAAAAGCDAAALDRAVAVLSVQRNLRILGIFARLHRRDGKDRYLRHLPRVWRHIVTDLRDPWLGDLRAAILATLPPPQAGIELPPA